MPVSALIVLGASLLPTADGAPASAGKNPVDAQAVARFPPPGTVIPGAFAFTPDGKALSYLKAEANSSTRVLWRVDLASGKPRVIARPPGSGDTDANVSQAEALRRERMRLRDSGITQVIRAEKADVAVIPLHGDLFILRGDAPLEQVTKTSAPEIDPKLTPDGHKVAFVRDDELHALDLASKKETQLTRGAGNGVSHAVAEFIAQEEMDRFSGFWWSPDGARIAYQETDERHIPLYPIVHQGGDSWTVEHHRYPFAGKENAKVKLGIVAATGGATRWLDLSQPKDEVYLARVNWESPTSLLVQLLSRDQRSLKLVRFNAETGERSRILEESAETWVNLHNHLRVLHKRSGFLWSSERTGFRHLEVRDAQGALVRVLTKGDWPVDDVLGVDEERGEVWFSAGKDDPRQLQAYRVPLDGGAITPVTTTPGTHRVVVSSELGHYVDTFSDIETPPVTTLRDRDGKNISTLADAADDPRLKEYRLVAPALTEFKNRDGVTLYGAYYAPRSSALTARGKVPLVVIVYGGPHVQTVTDSWMMTADMMAQFLNERGFAVWKADNRGAHRRGHAFEAALNRRMGELEVSDQVDGVRFAAASWPTIDRERVGVTGGSYGGYMTLRCLELAPETFRAGVSIAPVTDWDGYDTCYTERYMGTIKDNAAGYKASSVLTRASDLKGDLLLIHGLLDENVHYRHTARLLNALVAAGKPFSILPLPDSRHGARRAEDRRYVATRTAAFFEASLRATER